MQQLFQFIGRYKAFFTFLLLEFLCGWLIVYNNNYQGAAFFNSANRVSGSIFKTTNEVKSYFSLRQVNEVLAEENTALKNLLEQRTVSVNDSLMPEGTFTIDSGQYIYHKAKVVNNSVFRFSNFITINVGTEQGIAPDMGVISPNGAIGKVKAVSENYATLYSLLNTSFYISAKIVETNTFCTAKWDGKDPKSIDILYVPRHIKLEKGFQVVTSGYNTVFPEGVAIATIQEIAIGQDASFYQIDAELVEDFHSLSYVYVIENKRAGEMKSLEEANMNGNE